MFPSVFSDELGLDLTEAGPVIRSWGLAHVDLRGRVFGKHFEQLDGDELRRLRQLLKDHGLKVGCLQSSLAKVQLPDRDRLAAESAKLDAVLRAAEVLDCRLVRSFFFWQPPAELRGKLAERSDLLQQALDRYGPLAERARAAGLILGFENCGATRAEVFALLDALNVPEWGMAWDVYNDWAEEARQWDEGAYLIRVVKRTKMVHVKAAGAVPGTAPESIPYDRVLQACDSGGVAGPVSAETHNPDRTVSNEEMTRRVVEVIQRAWPTAAPGGLEAAVAAKPQVSRPWAENPVGFVVVGLGMGHNRAKQITQTPGTRLIGVCDLLEDRARRTGEACDVPWTTDLESWLDEKRVEAVMVMTETGKHAEITLAALEAGKHVLTTKPMEADVTACDRMIAKAEEKGLLLAVDLDRRHHPEVLTLKAAVADGWFGRLLSATCTLKILRTSEYFEHNGGWRGTRRWDGGGVLSNQSVHHLDELIYILGPPAQVQCTVWTQTHEIEAEDLGTAHWLYPDGLVVTYLATSSYPQRTWYHHLEVEGQEGAFHAASGGPYENAVTRWFKNGAWSDEPPRKVESAWVNSMDNFAAAVRTGAPLLCSGREGRLSRAVIDAMYRSAEEAGGGWVEVEAGGAG